MKKSPLPVQNVAKPENQYPGKENLVKLLKQHFGYSEFRGKQLEAIEAILSGKDCFCLMPTGGGKSMCYQIPALAKTGIVLVVCPLIALMENQVMALKEKGIAAEYLSSTQMSQMKKKIHEDLDSGKPSLRLLYVTPELIATKGFMPKLTKLYSRGLLNLIAIDEAHCISSWGHDFRPSYRKLSSLRNALPGVPILALTATAVPKVEKDVIDSLCLHDPLVLRSSFNRPNIFYEVRYKDLLEDVYTDLANQLKSSGSVCAIVYCLERASCDALSAHLLKNGISSAAYHAGLNSKQRSSVLDDWLSSRIQVVVATVAFGMGIDRKDVRIVCHFNIPKSMESFYQESGRAGRDQKPSRSLLYYGMDDRNKMQFILSKPDNKKVESSGSEGGSAEKSLAAFKQMVEYCEESGCRRKKILKSFEEQVPASLCGKTCDACKHPNLVASYLEQISHGTREKSGFSRIFISSSSGVAAEDRFTEFWNRDDEASGSEDDISDSDDEVEIVKNLPSSKFSSKSGLNEKFAVLQRAEEDYYQREAPTKQKNNLDKKAISEELRKASKQRLLNSLKQAEQRLGNLKIELEASAALLENECYKRYGKVGRTFYSSQVASTVRWLSTSSFMAISNRLGSTSSQESGPCKPDSRPTTSSLSSEKQDSGPCKPDSCPTTSSLSSENHKVQGQVPAAEVCKFEILFNDGSQTFLQAPEISTPSQTIKNLPPIPSFSEFVRKGKDNRSIISSTSTSNKHTSTRLQKDAADKRMRLQ